MAASLSSLSAESAKRVEHLKAQLAAAKLWVVWNLINQRVVCPYMYPE